MKHLVFLAFAVFLVIGSVRADVPKDEADVEGAVDYDMGASREGSRTDDEVVKREEEAIKLDGLNVAQLRELREKSEKFVFQTEVNRMMKLIINSLYRNKEIFLRELISNASDALDKIRLLSLTDKGVLDSNPEMNIRIKTDKEAGMIHITDSGIGMTKQDLVNNLGTIAKSGTAEFLNKMQDASSQDMNDMIGQFGVGFYSSFLVADRVIVTTKHNDDKQHIWESDSASFSIVEDPRGDTLKRGTTISLELKPEAKDYLEHSTIKDLVKKYSQFINFPIYLWTSHVEKEEQPIEDDETPETPQEVKPADEDKPEDEAKSEAEDKPEDEDKIVDEEDGAVEEEKEEEKPKTKTIEKTVWDWELLNDSKPIWTRKAAEIAEEEYEEFYKALTKDTSAALTKVHFFAEGEVSFKSLLFIPAVQPSESFNKYGTKTDNIKLFVRRVFITDEFSDIIPSYLAFLRGIVDSDDLPLNVSRETLQQHKLIKVIKKKVVRKVLDTLKKLPREEYLKFWKEYSTNIKLGLLEDPANRTRLAKLLMYHSSSGDEMVSLAEYVSRMKPKQDRIYYITGATKEELAKSPFVERLLRKNYEVLYLIDPVDEYAISGLPDFDGKKFQNLAKEGFYLNEGNAEQFEELRTRFEPLTKWLSETALSGQISKATVSERLADSPCALVASVFGWTGNMERLSLSNAHQKSGDPQRDYYRNQRKAMEINPRHPLMKELLRRVSDDAEDPTAKDIALMLYRTATLRSGYLLQDTLAFAESIEKLMKKTLGVSLDEQVEEEDDVPEDGIPDGDDVSQDMDAEEHDEL